MEETEVKKFVLTLDSSNFSDVYKHDFIGVEFYAPWYGFLDCCFIVVFILTVQVFISDLFNGYYVVLFSDLGFGSRFFCCVFR